MNPATRNLYRAAEPTFRLDGTPQVSIPSQVLTLGPENKKEYVIGQFHRCSLPPGGLIHAVVNRLWGRSCKIGCRKITESSYMFHIPHDSTRQWVVQGGIWHVDDCLLFVSPWKPVNSLKVPEISTILVWVTLKNVSDCCYSRLGLSHVASGLGEPMQTHKPRLDPTCLGEAKLLVEVELDKPFPKQIALDDKQGNIFLVDVEYTWIPSICGRCGQLGHKGRMCLLPAVQETSHTEDLSNKSPRSQTDKEQGQFTVVSDHEMIQVENSEMETQAGVEQVLSTPPHFPAHSPIATTQKDSSTVSHSSLDAKSIPAATLACSSSAPTFHQIMDNVPSDIIISEGIKLSGNDPLTMTLLSTESNQELGDIESDLCITEQIDEFGSMTRSGRLVKPTQKYQGNEWFTVRGKGNEAVGIEVLKSSGQVSFLSWSN